MKKLVCYTSIVCALLLLMATAIQAEEIAPGADATIAVCSVTGEVLTDDPVTLQPWVPIAVKATLTISNGFTGSFPIVARAVVGSVFDYIFVGTKIYQPGTYVGTHYLLPQTNWSGNSTQLGGKVWIRYQETPSGPVIDDSSTLQLFNAAMP